MGSFSSKFINMFFICCICHTQHRKKLVILMAPPTAVNIWNALNWSKNVHLSICILFAIQQAWKKIIAHGKAININFLIHILLYVDERGNTQHFIFSNFLDYLILFCCCFAFLFWGFVKFPVRIVIQIQIENSMQWRRLWCWHTISLPHPAFVW